MVSKPRLPRVHSQGNTSRSLWAGPGLVVTESALAGAALQCVLETRTVPDSLGDSWGTFMGRWSVCRDPAEGLAPWVGDAPIAHECVPGPSRGVHGAPHGRKPVLGALKWTCFLQRELAGRPGVAHPGHRLCHGLAPRADPGEFPRSAAPSGHSGAPGREGRVGSLPCLAFYPFLLFTLSYWFAWLLE